MEISYGQKLMENSWNSFKNISWDISVRVISVPTLSSYSYTAPTALGKRLTVEQIRAIVFYSTF